jgi:HK97 family phage major capsid protein
MSKEILDLIEKGNQAFADFKRINDEKTTKTEADRKVEMEKAFADMDGIKKSLETIEAKMKRPGFGGEGKVEDEAQSEHKKAFDGYFRKGIEFDLSIEQKALASSTNSGADGGYAVPKVIDTMLEELLINVSPIRQIANVVQISTSDYHKLVNKRGTSSGWVGETDARPATNTPQLVDIVPTMGELYANPMATQRMLDDVFFNAEQWLADNVAEEFAMQEGAAFINGNGSNKPTGFLAGTINATGDASRAFGAIQYVPTGAAGDFAASNKADFLYTLVGSLKAGYRQDACFVLPKATLFEIAAFKDANGRYLFDFSTVPGKPSSLLGYSVVEAEDMPAKAANAYGIAFGNFKRGYLIADRVGMRVVRDPFSNKPYIGFYTTKRVGGAVVNSEAIKVAKFAAS